MISDKELKKIKKKEFKDQYDQFYPIKTLKSMGFSRHICKNCSRGFWSAKSRTLCGEPECGEGYTFIGKKGLIKKFDYKGSYDLHTKFYKKFGYVPIKRYPVISRWYDKLYFVSAGINIFQPYVVTGEISPPAQATTEDQFCLRFNDIDNVGITGRHYTGFIMIGHHVFNTPEKYLYFKEEGVKQFTDFFIEAMGVKKDELILHEDVWVGGGNFGPSIEFFAYGLELGNQVYMQYEQLPDGSSRELKTKVIDMGSGAERWVWLSSGEAISYDAVFPKVMDYLYKTSKVKADKKVLSKFAKWASILNVDEVEDLDKAWKLVSEKTGISSEELKKEILPVSALYSIADHTRTVLLAINDGELPSNVGGGYNLRNLLRRCFSFIDQYNWDIDIKKVFKLHIKEFGKWYTNLKEKDILFNVIDLEYKRYKKTMAEGKKIIEKMINKKEKFDIKNLLRLYESNGITPELIKHIAPDVKLPTNFYAELDELKQVGKMGKEELPVDVAGISKTHFGFRKDQQKMKFKGKIIDQKDNYVILEETYFYPRMGGQDYDLGTIGGIPLKAVWIKDGVVLHELAKTHNFKKGEQVDCKLDESRRDQLTKTHTAVHLVGHVVREILGKNANQAGTEKTIEKGKLDVTHYKTLTFEEYQELEKRANELIKKEIEVKINMVPRNQAEQKYGMTIYQGGAVPGKELRIVQVVDDVQACGGTHLSNIKDIKFIKFINAERVKDGVIRVEFMVGDKAVEKAQENEKILKDLSKLWDVSYDELPKTAKKFFEEWKDLKKQIEDKSRMVELVSTTFNIVVNDQKVKSKKGVLQVPTKLDPKTAMKILDPLTKLINNTVILKGRDFVFVIANNEVNALKQAQKLAKVSKGNEKKALGFQLKK